MKGTSESERRAWFPGDVVLGMRDDCIEEHKDLGRPIHIITQLEYTAAKVANKFIERMVKK